MIKKILILFIVGFFSKSGFSQCAIENWSLEKRVSLSTLVIEGRVIDQYPFRENGRNAIYTASVIEVIKIFKGQVSNPYFIEIITFGGQIGTEKHHASPELELQKEDVGIFLLTSNQVDIPDFVKNNGKAKYQGTASIQSIISYDFELNRAFDNSTIFKGITTTLYETLQNLTKKTFTPIKSLGYNPERLKYRPTATPIISTFGSGSGNAGTGDILTINGLYFGSIRGNGRVEFIDANYGDGRTMKTPYAADYTVWNDTQIKVRIPARAGTGNIKVANNDSSSSISINSFKINFAHMNLGFKPTGGADQYYTTDLVNDNNKGGYTFQFNTRFKANSNMVNSFLRSMETWRCGTLVNWDIGRDTTIKVTAGDQVNLVRLTKFTDNKLAVCYTYWQYCYISGTNMEWSVSELDIEADSTRNWYYGTGNPTGSQYDFQSVLSHELGHGHQLGHVINNNEMMHYSISNGQKKSNLSTNDKAGGKYVMDKSVQTNVCAVGAMKALTTTTCGYTKAAAGFKIDKLILCINLPVVYTDTSKGIVKIYKWDFGNNASPATANTKGPHTVTYTAAGKKTVTLMATNDFGTDTLIKTNYIEVYPSKPSPPKNLTYSDTACLGITTISIDTLKEAGSLVWQLPVQSTVISTTINSKRISWTSAGGPYPFWVKVVNQCGSSDSLTGQVIVLNNPTCSFTAVENGRTVTFTNTSQYATSYKWLFGDGDSSALPNPVHIYPVGKAYTATLKAINKCKSVILAKTVNPFHPAGIDKTEIENTLVYPNPTNNILFLSNNISAYTLMDATGKILSEGKEHQIDMVNKAMGVYILNIHIYNRETIFIKVIKN